MMKDSPMPGLFLRRNFLCSKADDDGFAKLSIVTAERYIPTHGIANATMAFETRREEVRGIYGLGPRRPWKPSKP